MLLNNKTNTKELYQSVEVYCVVQNKALLTFVEVMSNSGANQEAHGMLTFICIGLLVSVRFSILHHTRPTCMK